MKAIHGRQEGISKNSATPTSTVGEGTRIKEELGSN
jgi:hypothetical protein